MQTAMSANAMPCVSPLILSDRMLSLARDAERAGLAHTADHLVVLAHIVLDERAGEPDPAWA